MTYHSAKTSNYIGQADDKLKDYLVAVDRDLGNLFRVAAPFYQFGTGTDYSVLTYSSTGYGWFGTVGGWSITNALLYGGSGSTYIGLQPGVGIWMGDSAFATSVFSVDPTGQMKAHAGEIGGWYIGTTTLSSTNLVFDSYNELLQSANFVSGALGKGWRIDQNVAEFQDIRLRGKISTSVFEKTSVSSIGGNFLVSDSDILGADMTAADTSTMTVLGTTSFAINDILRIKDTVSDEWFTITGSTSALGLTVTRDQGNDYSANSNPIWKKGTAVVNFGTSGDGLIFMTASETNSPYLDVVTHAGSPWDTLTTRVRLGNLNGFLGYVTDAYGIAIGESTKYLKYDPTNGLQIKGTVTLDSNSSVSNLAASSVAGWAAGGDTTKIDGGKIYTSSILADSISATAITTSKIAASAITADKLNVSQLDSITVNTGTLTVDEYIQSSNYIATTTGFRLSSSSGLEVNTGIILGTVIDRTQSIFTSSGTFVAPSGTSQVFITMCGGGGGGGGGEDDASGGGGGGGGGAETIVKYPFTVTGGSSYTVTIGLGGPGGAQKTDGSIGSSTSFSSVTVLGGYPGVKGGGAANGAGGGARGTLNASNLTPGGLGLTSGTGSQASSLGDSGAGGGTLFGIGGAGKASQGGVGNNATGYGAGGGGGPQGAAGQPGFAGGNGSPGICIVEW